MTLSTELLAHSAFSFLDGASEPEELVARAAALGYSAVALADFGGVYGAPRFFQAARKAGLKAIVGAEVRVAFPGPSPLGVHRCSSVVSLLVRSRAGYRNLCRLLTRGTPGGPGECVVTLDELTAHAGGLVAVAGRSLAVHDEPLLDRLAAIFPRGDLVLAISRHGLREEERDNHARVEVSRRRRLPLVATNEVRYAAPDRAALYDVMTCLRNGTTLENAGRLLSPDAERQLRPPEELAALFSDLPEAVAAADELGERCAFTLQDLGYRFPDAFAARPDGGRRAAGAGVADARALPSPQERHRAQLEKELARSPLGLAGYFLVVHDIVRFAAPSASWCRG